jgi:hypothetical protein
MTILVKESGLLRTATRLSRAVRRTVNPGPAEETPANSKQRGSMDFVVEMPRTVAWSAGGAAVFAGGAGLALPREAFRGSAVLPEVEGLGAAGAFLLSLCFFCDIARVR